MKHALQKLFGIQVQETVVSAPGGLPFYMVNGRGFHRLQIGEVSFLIVSLPDEERFGVIALEKQLVQYMDSIGIPVAYMFSAVNKKQRDALIERQIPFICLPYQFYLPFLGIALSNEFPNLKRANAERMSPSAQVLYLYFLYQARELPVIKKEAAEDLQMTRMSVTRASEQLLAMGLITQDAHGKEQQMKATAVGRDYYELGKPYLINPVQRIITTKQSAEIELLPLSGESALSVHSMLNEPKIIVKAIDKSSNLLKTLPVIDERWEPDKQLVQIECWKYNPSLFAAEGSVDPVSLAVSLKDHPDERVQGELEEYLEGLKW